MQLLRISSQLLFRRAPRHIELRSRVQALIAAGQASQDLQGKNMRGLVQELYQMNLNPAE